MDYLADKKKTFYSLDNWAGPSAGKLTEDDGAGSRQVRQK